MAKIPLARHDASRTVLRTADILLRNRWIEQNPVLADDYSFIARPGLQRWINLGNEPVRAEFHAPGIFNDDHFVVSGDVLSRVTVNGVPTTVSTSMAGSETAADVSMAATGTIGDGGTAVPSFLWIADGQALYVYTDNAWARGTLTALLNPSNGDVVRIDTVYYQFTSGSVDAGSPAGTVGAPWLVAIGISAALSLENLFNAINDTGTGGTDYSTVLIAHPTVRASSVTANDLVVRAVTFGSAGNAIVTTETGANIAWGGGTLANGGLPGIIAVPLPGDYAPVSVGYINGYVIVVIGAGQNVNGRFYWIEPGETTVDPLNFATAERSPDPAHQVVIYGDQFWISGQSTTEAYFLTGNLDAPISRVQGVLFDRGTIPGTALQVKGSMIIADNDGGVFQIQGGQRRISTPQIEERIRKAIARQNFLSP
ncbi:MAG TPA: hypothetical protein PLB04_17150 [Nitrospira sp.]|nr:hypothetical protein [Nitrospira sp.]